MDILTADFVPSEESDLEEIEGHYCRKNGLKSENSNGRDTFPGLRVTFSDNKCQLEWATYVHSGLFI